MDKLTIYCEVDFINKLNQPDKLSDNFLSWRNFLLLLGSRVLLILDKNILSDDGIKNEEIRKYIIDQYHLKQFEIEFNDEIFKEIKSLNLNLSFKGNELILMDHPKDSCHILANKYRLKIISSENALDRFQNLFIRESYTIQSGKTNRKELIELFKAIDTRPVKKLLINDRFLGKHKDHFYSFVGLILKGEKPDELIVSCHEELSLFDFAKSLAEKFKVKSVIAFKYTSIHNRKFFTEYIWGYLGHSMEMKFNKNGISIQSDNLNINSIYYPKQVNNGVTGFDEYRKNIDEYLVQFEQKKRKKLKASFVEIKPN